MVSIHLLSALLVGQAFAQSWSDWQDPAHVVTKTVQKTKYVCPCDSTSEAWSVWKTTSSIAASSTSLTTSTSSRSSSSSSSTISILPGSTSTSTSSSSLSSTSTSSSSVSTTSISSTTTISSSTATTTSSASETTTESTTTSSSSSSTVSTSSSTTSSSSITTTSSPSSTTSSSTTTTSSAAPQCTLFTLTATGTGTNADGKTVGIFGLGSDVYYSSSIPPTSTTFFLDVNFKLRIFPSNAFITVGDSNVLTAANDDSSGARVVSCAPPMEGSPPSCAAAVGSTVVSNYGTTVSGDNVRITLSDTQTGAFLIANGVGCILGR